MKSKEYIQIFHISWYIKWLLLISAVLVNSDNLFSQSQTNNWFFTNNGLNFSSGNPVNIIGGQIIVMEGASAISDKNGQLLFYTDGITVWSKNHTVMPNGQGLAGGFGSSTQSCIIVPKTKDEKEYYIFTTDDEGRPQGFQYSIVDMSLNGGLGSVIIKNQPLVTPCSEKVTVIKHCNKKDYWVITHKYGSDAYYSYLATENGVNPNPVISITGSFIPVTYSTMAGALKASPDGKKIIAMHANIGAELSDFNNQTGVISNTIEIFNNNNALHYGAEFSANSKVLYISIHGYWYQADLKRYSGVFQFDLSLPTITGIVNSKFEVYRYNPISEVGTMQRGSNGKIYMSQYQKAYLSVVNSPEVYGAGCNFVDIGVSLPAPAKASLPNFLNDYSTSVDSFRVTSTGFCVGKPVTFNYTATGDVTALLWNFGNPPSGSLNNSTSTSPSHTFSSPGNYTIKLIKYSPCGNDTISKQISVGSIQLSLGNDAVICEKSTYLITPQTNGVTSFLWQDGSTLPTYTASSAGLFWVQVSNSTNGCILRDTIIITTKLLPVIDLGRDTSLCTGKTLLLNAFSPGLQYIWQDNSTNSTLVANNPGIYWVQATLNGCIKRDTINISSLTNPKFTLGSDQYLCPGISLFLTPGLSNVSYTWQDGNTSSSYKVNTPGLFYVDITNTCGTTRGSINILSGNCTIRVPSAFTPNNDGLNDQFRVLGTQLISEFDFKIFNRYGQLIFHSLNKDSYWNGFFKGVKVVSGAYMYLLTYKSIGSQHKNILKGSILLIP
jgi:gliding motility-associated-like protein